MDRLVAGLSAVRGPWAYAWVFGLLAAAGIGVPVNEDVVIVGSAALTFYGVFRVEPLIATILLGLLVGDTLLYHWGYRYGEALVSRRPFSWAISPAKLAAARARFSGGGAGLIFCTRFLPGVRAPIHFSAGTLRISLTTFVACDMGAALLEVPALVFAVRYVGGNAALVLAAFKRIQYVALAGFFVWLALRIRRYWLPVRDAA